MKTKLIAGVAVMTMALAAGARADDPNPDVAKAIQEIAARRAEKEQARVRQTESWAKNEAQERGWNPGVGGGTGAAPGGVINKGK